MKWIDDLIRTEDNTKLDLDGFDPDDDFKDTIFEIDDCDCDGGAEKRTLSDYEKAFNKYFGVC